MNVHERLSDEMGIAICGCLLLTVGSGLIYSVPVLFVALAQHFAVPVWHLAACFSVGGAISFAIGGWSGARADQYGTPVMVTAGFLIAAGGFVLASVATSEWMFALGYVVGVGAAVGLTYAPVTAAVQVLSTTRKVVTAGITSSGVGFGPMLLPPAVGWLLHVSGYRVALMAMAGIAVMGILPVLALRGMVNKAPPPTGISALRTNANFRWAFVGQMLFAIMVFVLFAHLVNIALWHGWDAAEGIELISLLGFSSTMGRFLVTPFAQTLGACRTAFFCVTVTAAAMVGIAAASAHWIIWSNVALFGLTYGAVIALSAPIVSVICGGVDVGRNVGTLISARAVGVLVGPWSVGVTQWSTGSFTAPLLICALLGLIAAVCFERSGSQQRKSTALV
jgi:MFS family permease